jgi:hypothetical protein
MSLDQQGFVWMHNPWIAALAIVVAVGLLLWCHLSLGADDLMRPAAASARFRRSPRSRRLTTTSSQGLSSRVSVARERRDANRRCVA